MQQPASTLRSGFARFSVPMLLLLLIF